MKKQDRWVYKYKWTTPEIMKIDGGEIISIKIVEELKKVIKDIYKGQDGIRYIPLEYNKITKSTSRKNF
jgi:hypothetical protein